MIIPTRPAAVTLTIALLSTGVYAQARPAPPKPIEPVTEVQVETVTLETVSATTHIDPTTEDKAKAGERVSLALHAVPGPVGQVFMPAALQSAFSKTEAGAGTKYRYPSISFTISATPVITPVKKAGDGTAGNPFVVKDVLYDDLDMRWMDVMIELDPLDGSNKPLPCSPDHLQVLALLPSETTAGLVASRVPGMVGAVDEAVDVALPFVPGPGAALKGASSLATIVFKNLFPPKPKSFQHAALERNCRFGWFFRQDETTRPSILGLQNGAVLMRTHENVKRIRVRYSILSRWNGKLTDKTEFKYVGAADVIISIPEPAPRPSLSDLADISELPVMLERADAMQLLRVTEQEYAALIADESNGFKVVGGGAYVTRASVEAFLGLQKKKDPQ